MPKISNFIQDWLKGNHAYADDPEQRYLTELAIIEACTNIIRYAYPFPAKGRLGVCLRRTGQKVEILILDEGFPFDPTQNCSLDLDVPKESGYGLFLIRKIMSEIHYQRRGARWNLLLLIHRLTGDK